MCVCVCLCVCVCPSVCLSIDLCERPRACVYKLLPSKSACEVSQRNSAPFLPPQSIVECDAPENANTPGTWVFLRRTLFPLLVHSPKCLLQMTHASNNLVVNITPATEPFLSSVCQTSNSSKTKIYRNNYS